MYDAACSSNIIPGTCYYCTSPSVFEPAGITSASTYSTTEANGIFDVLVYAAVLRSDSTRYSSPVSCQQYSVIASNRANLPDLCRVFGVFCRRTPQPQQQRGRYFLSINVSTRTRGVPGTWNKTSSTKYSCSSILHAWCE